MKVDTVINFTDANASVSDRPSFNYLSEISWRTKVFFYLGMYDAKRLFFSILSVRLLFLPIISLGSKFPLTEVWMVVGCAKAAPLMIASVRPNRSHGQL